MAAPGPSLVPVREGPIIVVQDAWRLIPWADVLYGCDPHWWAHYQGTDFEREKWSTHKDEAGHPDNKSEAHEKWGVHCVKGVPLSTFSLDPEVIHHGNNSGFQAINLAILFGCTHITLIGFDMRRVQGRGHFFGEHPKGLSQSTDYERFIKDYDRAAKALPGHIRIVNATPDSALHCFPMMTFEEAMRERYVHDCNQAGLAHERRVSVAGQV